jgi:subtilisin family serine protease
MLYAADQSAQGGRAQILNLSLYPDYTLDATTSEDNTAADRKEFKRAMQYARSQGVVVVVAAGNSGRNLDTTQPVSALCNARGQADFAV